MGATASDKRTTLRQRYADYLDARDWQSDAAQSKAIDALEAVRSKLLAQERRGLLQRWFAKTPEPVRGLYLWGGVGRGKTFMMDLFASSLIDVAHIRSHFHRFMFDVHEALSVLSEEDPLISVADDIAARARVLCFDEFYVSDIGDAMILGRLVTLLIERGVTLVATSNIPPDELYYDGLQRARFLPAIDVLNAHCDVLHVDSPNDYRMRVLSDAAMYFWPCDEQTEQRLAKLFENLSQGQHLADDDVLVNGRSIPVLGKAAGVTWFSFEAICGGPRSQNDYIALARRVHTVLISGLPQLSDADNNATRRFIALVDEFYDRNVNLVLSADTALTDIYTGRKLAFAFERTTSRLTQMQTKEYLSRPHLP
ncbi:MAG: cell division protein ZapE [Pseudomonadota bacterium]